jgi:hypothetical protein
VAHVSYNFSPKERSELVVMSYEGSAGKDRRGGLPVLACHSEYLATVTAFSVARLIEIVSGLKNCSAYRKAAGQERGERVRPET